MKSNAIKTVIRQSKKSRGILLINITGLSVGIAVFIMIYVWISYQAGYDRYPGSENVYRLSFGTSSYLTAGEGPYFAENCVEIEKVARVKYFGQTHLSYGNNKYRVSDLRLADSTVFDIFPYELIQGNSHTALVAPGSVVLSRSVADRLFGDEDPLGKMIKINSSMEAVVTGVMKDPVHTFQRVEVLGSFVTLRLINSEPDILESLRSNQYQTYFRLAPNVDPVQLRNKIHKLNSELFSLDNPDPVESVELVNIRDLYFHPVQGPGELHGSRTLVLVFLAISLLTLLIACINFVNLSVARSIDASVEAGIRKINGASGRRLFKAFIFESLILTTGAGLLAIALSILLIPYFSDLVGTGLNLFDFITPLNILLYILLVAVIGIASGIVPAARFSSSDPLVCIRKMSESGRPSNSLRKSLVVFQYTVSAILIISVLVVMKQMKFIKNYNLGFNKENLLRVSLEGEIRDRMELFRERVLTISGVSDLAYSGSAFGSTNYEVFYYEDERYVTRFLTVDPGFFETMDIDLVSGRGFSYDRPSDRLNTCILNEEAARLIGIDPAEAPGKIINRKNWYLTTIPTEELEIIGISSDFNITSLRDSIPPYLICWGNWLGSANIRINTQNQAETIEKISGIWSELNPDVPFVYSFMEEQIEGQYSREERLGAVLVMFAIIAIIIASLGLLGLSSLTVQSRTKEIGIRKVHGAGRLSIMGEICKAFISWVIIALVIATPVAVIVMGRWLSDFAYHTSVSAGLVVLGWSALILISLATVLYHTLKISDTNPAETMRYE